MPITLPPQQAKKILERVEKARAAYASRPKGDFVNVLLYGDFGTGKTSFLRTCRKPIYIDCFDPGGTTTRLLADGVAAGDIIIDNRFERDDWKQPVAYKLWEHNFFELRDMNFFSAIGTYAIDSVTRMSDSLMYHLLTIPHASSSRSRAGQIPELKDYLVQQMTLVNILSNICQLPCDVIVTGHIGRIKDEVSGKIETGLMLSGKLSEKIPLLFDEKWIAVVAATSDKGRHHRLLMKSDGYYQAETRIGGGIFADYEEPDMKYLLKKVGRDSSDKPPISSLEPTSKTDGG